jgi:dTDP-4-amino-4,6-dideoxygalactose transaminase
MLGLRALVGVSGGRRREVLMPSFTFAATINAVLWAGLEPVFLDVEEHSWHLDPARLEHALAIRGGSVAAVLACSTFGVPPSAAHRAAWEDAARAAGVPLLVDSAAGFGATGDDGQVLGRQGDVEVFSFHATKPFAIGEGGLVTTNNDEIAHRMIRLTNFGFEGGLVDTDVGLNATTRKTKRHNALCPWPPTRQSQGASSASTAEGRSTSAIGDSASFPRNAWSSCRPRTSSKSPRRRNRSRSRPTVGWP